MSTVFVDTVAHPPALLHAAAYLYKKGNGTGYQHKLSSLSEKTGIPSSVIERASKMDKMADTAPAKVSRLKGELQWKPYNDEIVQSNLQARTIARLLDVRTSEVYLRKAQLKKSVKPAGGFTPPSGPASPGKVSWKQTAEIRIGSDDIKIQTRKVDISYPSGKKGEGPAIVTLAQKAEAEIAKVINDQYAKNQMRQDLALIKSLTAWGRFKQWFVEFMT